MINSFDVKSKLYQQCLDFVENRLQTVQKTIFEIQESLNSETKSSAGDKHETGRAMLQLEREKAGAQLAEIEKIKESLAKVDINKLSDRAGLGSVVYTTQANYFIAISAGQLEFDGEQFYAISPNTPIALLLMGRKVGDEVVFRDDKFSILKLF